MNVHFANPAGLALLGLAIPVILLHILKPRRQSITVSSTFLWRAIERPVSAAAPWQKLRWSWLLAAQLLAVALLAVAVARPVRLEDSALSEHTIFIIDTSASMAATDEVSDRVDAAISRASALRDKMPTGAIASIVVASERPRVVLTASDDRAAFDASLRTVDASSATSDFAAAFSLAESLDTATVDVGYVLISDGGLTADDERLLPPSTRYERVGSASTNRALTSLTVEPRGSGLHARAQIRNFGEDAVTQNVRIDVDGRTVFDEPIAIDGRSAIDVEADLPPGDRVAAYLDGVDMLAADNVAVAVAGRRPELRVLIAGDPLFWEQLFTSIPGVTVDVATVGVGESAPDGADYDVVVYSGVAVPDAPQAPFLAVTPPGGLPGAVASGVANNPVVTLLRSDDPLLANVDLTTVAIAQAQRVATTSAEVLAGAEGVPLILRGTVNEQRYVYVTFALVDSNLAVQVAFPILGDRILTELSGTALTSASLHVGDALPVDPSTAATIVDPDGQTRSFEPGDPLPRAAIAGFWTLQAADAPQRLVAVNAPPVESAIAPRPTLVPPEPETPRLVTPAKIQHSLLPWLAIPLLALLVVEAWLAWRRLGVGKKQWHLALIARGVVAALLIGALVAPTLARRSDRVATVFVIDGSASLGPAGDQAALDWVREAIDNQPDDALSAVVVFGGDARLDRVLQNASFFDAPTVVVDEGATDIAAALRLGGAVLPSDAKKRIVVVSDGRATTGDAASEAESLNLGDVRVDVHTLDVSAGTDAAVSVIEVPRLARVGESITVTVHVAATRPGQVAVELRRDNETVETRLVDVVAGDNPVTFTDNAGSAPGAVLRYQAIVSTPGDALPQNDAAFAAVPVDGPAKVLIVEGTSGEAASLNNALQAGGVATTVVGPADLPDVQTMSSYASIMLVNVHADSLTGAQIDALTTVVRDLGRGLVTLGGNRSYGVGGYRESPLGELLPVDSEILDPKRRKTVAEVLSIDTSGSMAACHCDEGSMNPGVSEGGVNKTDISRAAAQRTIEALTVNDQVGVLAWNSGTEWVIDLQLLPGQDVIDDGLGRLRPNGNTNLTVSLEEAADALLASNAELKHIILFTDGFTAPELIEQTADKAGELYNEFGITVSVLGTGEGAAPSLEDIAVQGHGRYYPGAGLDEVPQIMAEEAVIASRDFINEGQFLPEITSSDPVVAQLTTSPELLGYVATTAKPGSSTLLRIGPDRDPLLATWQAGLGRVTSWTSDASQAWAQRWANWDGYVNFWTTVAKDTFPTGDSAGAAQATVANGQINISVEGAGNFPDGSTATAIVAGPDGQRYEVQLDRVSGGSFEGSLPATGSGTYAVGAVVSHDGDVVLSSSTLANENYPAEYAPGQPDAAAMAALSAASGGRGEITPTQAFDQANLTAGVRRIGLAAPFLLAAALLWPLAVALSRLSLRGATLAGARASTRAAGRRVRSSLPKLGAPDPNNAPTTTAAQPKPPREPTGQTATMAELLEQKRQRQSDRER